MVLYKYLPKKYAIELLQRGLVHIRSASYFCNIEEDDVRGDIHDGARIVSNTMSITFNGKEDSITSNVYSVRSQQELKSSYIYCMSNKLDNELFERFEVDACICINDADMFIKRIREKASKFNIKKKRSFKSMRTNEIKDIDMSISYATKILNYNVNYIDETIVLDEIEIDKSKVVEHKFFCKRKSKFEWQDEYRLVFLPDGNINICFEKQHEKFMSYMLDKTLVSYHDLLPTGLNIYIGPIEDIAEVVYV